MVQEKQVLTSYFTSKKDAMQDKKRSAEDFDMMSSWYKSLHDLGLKGVIFHDHLSQEFRDKHNSDLLSFERVELGSRSPTDERFFHYAKYLQHNPVDQVIMTDLFDIEFKRDPFELMESDHQLYMGDETKTIGQARWLGSKFNIKVYLSDIEYPEDYTNYYLLNTGSIGGSREVIWELLKEVLAYFSRLPDELNANMPVWNYIARKKFDDEQIMHGRPWNSKFNCFEEKGDFCIKHK